METNMKSEKGQIGFSSGINPSKEGSPDAGNGRIFRVAFRIVRIRL